MRRRAPLVRRHARWAGQLVEARSQVQGVNEGQGPLAPSSRAWENLSSSLWTELLEVSRVMETTAGTGQRVPRPMNWGEAVPALV